MFDSLPYQIKRSYRTRSLRIAVHVDGKVVVTAPKRLHMSVVEKFMREKSAWVQDKLAYFSKFDTSLYKQSKRGDYRKYKEQALALVRDKITQFNEHYKFVFNQISIKNQKSRWGSCSRKGNLNFNYKIALLPEDLVDYIVVHELCHLGEFNHSANFWNLVAETMPDYKEKRARLKRMR
jgi:predicted metal-dependent hydrolase